MAETAKKRKRIVKDPETFRERAQKASETNAKTKVSKRAKSGFGKILAPIFGPIWKACKFIFNRQPFKFIGKVLSLIGKVLLPVYVRNSWKELKLVTWPSLKLSRQLTFAVLMFAIVFGAAIAIVDYGLDKLFRAFLLK